MKNQGALTWAVQNPIAANLLMVFLLVGGLLSSGWVREEVFPEFSLDIIIINIAYPGASPEEVEQGVVLVSEDAVRGLDGVKQVRSVSQGSLAVITVELLAGADASQVLANVKSSIDRITSYPEEIERPVVALASNKRHVISLIVHGDVDAITLRQWAEYIRDDALKSPELSVAELTAVKPLEMSVELTQDNLSRYRLTLANVANTIRQASVEMPGGGLKTTQGDILVRTTEQRRIGTELGNIRIRSRPDGTTVYLRDIATINDGLGDVDHLAFFNNQPAAMVQFYRVGSQGPVDISQAVRRYAAQKNQILPAGLKLTVWADFSQLYQDRMSLLLRNGYIGLILVFVILSLFLQCRLAFWVTLGILISFFGALLFLPAIDVSLNMISLFAFIVSLGIVVDDAIIIGEAIYRQRELGKDFLSSAIAGVQEVASPVIFSILTTMVAFAPILFVVGSSGKFFRVIPMVVILVLAISLIEALFILPAHLGHGSKRPPWRFEQRINAIPKYMNLRLQQLIQGPYTKLFNWAMQRRYLTSAICLTLLLFILGLVAGGHIKFTFLPKIDSDRVVANITLPQGAPVALSERITRFVAQSAQKTLSGIDPSISRGIFVEIGGKSSGFSPGHGATPRNTGANVGQVTIYLVPAGQRSISAKEFATRWRQHIGIMPEVESLQIRYSIGAGSRPPINFQLSHADPKILHQAALSLSDSLTQFAGIGDIDSGFSPGKTQLDFHLRPEARRLGLTELSLARQIRSNFFGIEATRQQRGRNELRTYVRLSKSERNSQKTLDNLLLSTPGQGQLPLHVAATIERNNAYPSIRRTDGRRVVNVTADVINSQANATQIITSIMPTSIAALKQRYAGLLVKLGGQPGSQNETLQSLMQGAIIALLIIYGLLAIACGSYIQPLIIMSALPFSLIGAFGGHLLLGFNISIVSLLGVVALTGIVVNDSLLLVTATNRARLRALEPMDALKQAATVRFRPILLTSITTFFGLLPLLLETSVQARFLIPMAVSLAFGVLFATIITLIFVPAFYLIVVDFQRWFNHKEILNIK